VTLGSLHLMRPEWLWALLPVLLLTFALALTRRRAGSWNTVIDPALLPYLVGEQGPARRRNLLPWLCAAWVLATLAMAGPSLQKIPQPVHQREDALVIVLDLSYSMKAADLAPSRLARAQQKILDLLKRRDEGQTGLIAFAGDAHVVAPLTDDNPTIANLLPALNPDMMPVPGSDARHATELALQLLRSGGAASGRILLLTDAVDAAQQEAIVDAVRKAGVELIVMGVGTRNGAPLPLPEGGFLKDPGGAIVVPTLDEQALASFARRAGGRYLPMQIDSSDLEQLAHRDALPGQERLSALDRRADQWEDQGYLLVLLLLPLAALLFRRGAVAAIPLALLLALPEPARAQSWDDWWLTPDQQGQRALEQGEAERASELFEDRAWAGTAAYRSGDYAGAAERFGEGDDADDWYNRGNALARSGDLQGAIEAYRESLARAPERSDAQDNLALVEQLLQQQKEQQEQQQQQQQQQDQQQQDQQQQSQSEDSQGGQQNQPESGDSAQRENDSAQNPAAPDDEQQRQDSPTEQQQGEQAQAQQEAPQRESAEAPEPGEDADSEEPNAQQATVDPEQAERDQAMEQWLRRVPDDPSGLLREKFRYESRQRLQEGETPRHDTYW
jgi:Ca-activated chloride channel family protein